MDAIKVLKDDHRKVEQLFADFEALGERAKKSKMKIIEQIVQELQIHTEIEEQIFYPAFEKAAREQEDLVFEAIEEHDVVKHVIRELQAIDLEHPRYEARVTVLKELVEHHVEEEEKEMFPMARKALGAARLRELGQELLALKERCLAGGYGRVTISMVKEMPVEQPENI